MKVGDIQTFAGHHEPEPWWIRVGRRMGWVRRPLPPLRRYVVTWVSGGEDEAQSFECEPLDVRPFYFKYGAPL